MGRVVAARGKNILASRSPISCLSVTGIEDDSLSVCEADLGADEERSTSCRPKTMVEHFHSSCCFPDCSDGHYCVGQDLDS